MLNFLIKTADAQTSRDSGDIKNLGRRAAKRFVDADSGSLTDAVVSIVREEGDLGRDQIRRVSEAANQAAWNSLFVEGGNNEASFDPADADHVMEHVAPGLPEVQDTSSDYDSPPPMRGMDLLEQAVSGDDVGPKYDDLDPASHEKAVHEKVAQARDFNRTQADRALLQLQSSGEELYRLIKVAYTSGEPYKHIVKAIDHACVDQAFAAELLKTAAARMVSEGIKVDLRKEAASEFVEIVEDHPLVEKTAAYEVLSREYVRAMGAVQKLEDASKVTMGAVRDKLRGV